MFVYLPDGMIKIQSESFQQKFNKMLYKNRIILHGAIKKLTHGHHIWFREGGTGKAGILKKGEMGRAGDWGSRVCFSWYGLCTGSY